MAFVVYSIPHSLPQTNSSTNMSYPTGNMHTHIIYKQTNNEKRNMKGSTTQTHAYSSSPSLFTLTRACTPGRNANLAPGAPKITFRESALFFSPLLCFSFPFHIYFNCIGVMEQRKQHKSFLCCPLPCEVQWFLRCYSLLQ